MQMINIRNDSNNDSNNNNRSSGSIVRVVTTNEDIILKSPRVPPLPWANNITSLDFFRIK